MSRIRAWGWEAAVFRIATIGAILHALDDAFLNRQPGVGLGQHALAAAISLVAGVGAMIAFPQLRPGFRAAISLAFGVLAATNGALHLIHITKEGASNSDLTGLLALIAGIVLIGLALWIPWRHRRGGASTTRRRWINRAIAVVGGFIVFYAGLYPTTMAIIPTHKYREPIPDTPRGYEDVTFESSDGLELSGWYRPSRNGAAVVIVHGGGGDRTGAVRHAELLAPHGYGVLVYDSRGRGESEGTPVSMGWGWERDVSAALAFLQQRPDVDPERIGGLGLSTGADVLFDVGADDPGLKAVVADGATAESFADYRAINGIDAAAPYWWTMYTAARVLSGVSPDDPLKQLVAQISPTPLLLISTGGNLPAELDANRVYAQAAREPVELWELPDVDHTAAIRQHPDEYARRVVGFLDEALLEDTNP